MCELCSVMLSTTSPVTPVKTIAGLKQSPPSHTHDAAWRRPAAADRNAPPSAADEAGSRG